MSEEPLHPERDSFRVERLKHAIDRAIDRRQAESRDSLQPVPEAVWDDEREAEHLAVEHAQASNIVSLAYVEQFYKRPGRTLLYKLIGRDPFDFWVWRFYVGLWGLVAALGIAVGTTVYLYQAIIVEGTWNLLQARIDPPPLALGLRFAAPGQPGFNWQLIVISATVAFVAWGMRQIDIASKLEMTYEIPICFFSVVSSWVTLQWLRPLAMGAWGNGFPLGITHHLDWVSNIGYQYYNFFYNPFHAIAVSLFFFSTMLLAMHASAILSGLRSPGTDGISFDMFWRSITIGYSIGEKGIHRTAFWVSTASVLFANLCIFLSGTLVRDWSGFWTFWNKLPWWTWGLTGVGAVGLLLHKRGLPEQESLERLQGGETGFETSFGIRGHFNLDFVRKLLGNGQIGPFYLGLWGVIGLFFFSASAGIILLDYLRQVDYNGVAFLREFLSLQTSPPALKYGLHWPGWNQGGNYLAATFFLHLSVLCWVMRLYARARATALGKDLGHAYLAALFLYFVIYLIRPLLLGAWSAAPAHGFKAILDWTNNVSVRTGNFYYNPFHMISIFFLFGSTLLLGIHGATIVSTEHFGAEKEIKEAAVEGPGTHRAQLFWRWTMGFNANAASIHSWAWWFAALCGISGAIGLLLSGTVVHNWYEWAQQVHIVAPDVVNADWSQYTQFAHWPTYVPQSTP